MRAGAGDEGQGDEGQAAVELALVLPLLALLLLGMVQVGLVVRDQVLLTHAAREAAREAAVNPSPEAAERAALAGAPLDPARLKLQLTTEPGAGRVQVQVVYRSPTMVPVIGPVLPDVTLTGVASMRIEVTAGKDPTGYGDASIPLTRGVRSMPRHRLVVVGLAGLALMSASAAMPASAQAPAGEVFQGEAKGTALEVKVLGQGATVGVSSARASSSPTALGEGAGVLGLAGTVARSEQPGGATSVGDQCAASPGLPPLVTSGLACGKSSAGIAGGAPSATAEGRVANLGIDATGLNITALTATLTNTLCGAVGAVPIGNILPGLPVTLPTTPNCTNLVTGVLGAVQNPANVTVGKSTAAVTTTGDRVTAVGTAAGATLNLLNIPTSTAAGVACSGVPLAAITIGDARATATYDRGPGTLTSAADPSLVTVDLCLIVTDPAPIKVPVNESRTILAGTPAETTITAAAGREFRGSAGAEAKAVELHALKGVSGGILASLAAASAIVDGGRPQVQGVEVVAPVGDLPRTGSGLPPWTPVAGFAMLAVAVLVGRTVVKAR